MRLNIGCGNEYKEGWKNIDISKEVKADEYYDIADGIKEKDCTVDEIKAYCILEQMDNKYMLRYAMNEMWRVLKPDGVLRLAVPDCNNIVAFQDPWDVLRFTKETFTYFDRNEGHYKMFGKTYGFKPWTVEHILVQENGIIIAKLIK